MKNRGKYASILLNKKLSEHLICIRMQKADQFDRL